MEQPEYERLLRLVEESDPSAAAAILAEAERRGDLDTHRRAAALVGQKRAGVRQYTLRRTKKRRAATPSWANELNEEQRVVVEAGAGPLLVVAGAGSGKTRTLTYRVARLLELGTQPNRILLLTFTTRAAREMIRRVGGLVEVRAEKVNGGTFHHIGHRILRRNAERLGYPENFAIMDSEDASTLMSNIVAEGKLASNKRRFPRGDVLQRVVSMSINTGCSIPALVERDYPHFADNIGEIVWCGERYAERKLELGLMDYDDLLTQWRRLFLEHEAIGQQYAEHFEHVLVDEYQDTNALQSEIVDLCARHHRNVMVVGDDCQSIYAFRGANHENILRFPQRYPDCRKFLLETNYRSTPQIVTLANRSIAHNERRFEKTLRAFRGPGALPVLVPARDMTQQAQFIAERILELHETGHSLRDIAVLYRAHYQSVEIQLELTRANIPFTIRSGLRFFEQAHVKDVLSFLRFVHNPRDELSFMRIATLVPGVGDRSARKVWEVLEQAADPFRELATSRVGAAVSRENARHALGRTVQLLHKLAGSLKHLPAEQISQIVDFDDYKDHLAAKYKNVDNRVGDLEELARFAEQFDSLDAFLDELALVSGLSGEDIAEGSTPDEYVVLSSVHQAKGLEWPVVFLSSLWDGGFPTASGMETSEAEEEERRLFYVAVTRARDELLLTYPLSRRDRGGFHRVLRASPFVSELYEPGLPPRSELFEEWSIAAEEGREDVRGDLL